MPHASDVNGNNQEDEKPPVTNLNDVSDEAESQLAEILTVVIEYKEELKDEMNADQLIDLGILPSWVTPEHKPLIEKAINKVMNG
jgi:hypothetical protein